MFERQRTVLRAAGGGYLLAGFLLALAVGAAAFVARQDPHRLPRDWEAVLAQRVEQTGAAVLAGVLLFAAALAGLILSLAVAARARRLHPTSATLGGLLVAAGLVALAGVAVWTGVVAPYAALQYRAATDELRRHALLMEAHLGEHVAMLGFWCFLGLAAPGLYFLGRALRGERGWAPDSLKLAAALILLHLPVTLYLAQQSLLHQRHVAWLAVLDQLLLWGGLAAACYLAARWLRRVGRTLPP
ncbi:MAG: hypothetical protein HY656_04140 [Acidobacteria bacterium]|nr:hypothetical protein [Acidobacteriota bacterium]